MKHERRYTELSMEEMRNVGGKKEGEQAGERENERVRETTRASFQKLTGLLKEDKKP